jgi:hypothetical protein
MEFDTIHNYYERAVIAEVVRAARVRGVTDQRLLADIACVALNHLPPRYIRYDVDFAFYLTDEERRHNAEAVEKSVARAFDFVLERERERKRAA